jgi:23S rRNA (uracil1939-C5)-methyltransferase
LEYGYRNRIRVHVDGGCTGFFAHGSHNLVNIERCPISAPAVNESLSDLRQTPVPPGDYTLSARERGDFFEQTNTEVANAMVEVVRARLTGGYDLLIDAYCGAGFFARRLTDKAARIVGIEENQYAVEYARRAAGERELYVAGDVAEQLGDVLQSAEPGRTVVILDPPAAGISTRVSELLLGRPPAEIIYVSCDPATLARDLGVLCRSSYKLESVTPLDMFPQTAEVEVVACLTAR